MTTHKELGDVTGGREVTLGNYYEIFDGLLTAEQMEGLKELCSLPNPHHLVQPHRAPCHRRTHAGVSCLACHVNGHTNEAIQLTPDARPTRRGCGLTRPPCEATST